MVFMAVGKSWLIMVEGVRLEIEVLIALCAGLFTYLVTPGLFGVDILANWIVQGIVYVGYYVAARIFWHYSRKATYQKLDKWIQKFKRKKK